jgi:hypothetical protein
MLIAFRNIVDMDTRLAVQEAAGSVRQPGGVPMPERKCEEGFRQMVALIERGDANSEIFFHTDFLRVLDAFLSQLITWAEAQSPAPLKQDERQKGLKDWAGTALAERLRFLSSQEQEWDAGNEAFAAAQKKFGDRRGARTPRSYLGWLACDYVRILQRERHSACLALDTNLIDGESCAAELLSAHNLAALLLQTALPDHLLAGLLALAAERKKRLRELAALEELSPESAPMWAQMVYERMLVDENKILSAAEMRGRQSRDAKRRTVNMEARSAAPWIRVGRSRTNNVGKALHSLTLESERQEARVKLADYKQTITRVVIKLAEKPRGGVRGVTRP